MADLKIWNRAVSFGVFLVFCFFFLTNLQTLIPFMAGCLPHILSWKTLTPRKHFLAFFCKSLGSGHLFFFFLIPGSTSLDSHELFDHRLSRLLPLRYVATWGYWHPPTHTDHQISFVGLSVSNCWSGNGRKNIFLGLKTRTSWGLRCWASSLMEGSTTISQPLSQTIGMDI